MKIENMLRANRSVSIADTVVEFDENGIAEVSDAIGARLLRLGVYREAGKPAAVKPQQAAPTTEESSAEKTSELDAMNTAQLKKLAKDMGIEIGDASKKADLIALIEKTQGK